MDGQGRCRGSVESFINNYPMSEEAGRTFDRLIRSVTDEQLGVLSKFVFDSYGRAGSVDVQLGDRMCHVIWEGGPYITEISEGSADNETDEVKEKSVDGPVAEIGDRDPGLQDLVDRYLDFKEKGLKGCGAENLRDDMWAYMEKHEYTVTEIKGSSSGSHGRLEITSPTGKTITVGDWAIHSGGSKGQAQVHASTGGIGEFPAAFLRIFAPGLYFKDGVVPRKIMERLEKWDWDKFIPEGSQKSP